MIKSPSIYSVAVGHLFQSPHPSGKDVFDQITENCRSQKLCDTAPVIDDLYAKEFCNTWWNINAYHVLQKIVLRTSGLVRVAEDGGTDQEREQTVDEVMTTIFFHATSPHKEREIIGDIGKEGLSGALNKHRRSIDLAYMHMSDGELIQLGEDMRASLQDLSDYTREHSLAMSEPGYQPGDMQT